MKLFIAIDFNEPTLDALANAGEYLCRQLPVTPCNLEERADLHLTLRYLGSHAAPEQITARLSQISAPAFHMHLHGAGAFQNSGEAVLWAGVEGELHQLYQLKNTVDAALMGLPLSPEALPFSPHITLTTLEEHASACAGLIKECPVEAASFEVRSFHLYTILDKDTRPRFQKLATFPLEREERYA